MKKLAVLITCLIFAGAVSAQQHLTFKGVPIDGTLKAYTEAMVKAGFTHELTQDGCAVLSGDFAGFKGCFIGVTTLKNCDVVSRIAVLFPERKTWASILDDYEHLKAMLTEKYGKPTNSEEKFTEYVGDGVNSLVMHALREEKYVWFITFTTELGEIKLSVVAGSSYSTGLVCLTYKDKANSEKVHSSAMDDL